MEQFSQKIPSKYKLDTFEGTLKAYEWIHASLAKLNLVKKDVKVTFQFRTGEITCNCDSLEKFIELAYGQAEYELINLSIMRIVAKNEKVFINSFWKDQIYVDTDNKVLLAKIVKSLAETDIENNDVIEIIKDIKSEYNLGDICSGNNIIIQGNNNLIVRPIEQASKIKKWLEAILQNILANWVWLVISAVISAFMGYFIIK